LSFITRSGWGSAKELINILEEANQEVPDGLQDMAQRFEEKKARREQEKRAFDK
jgi:ATP-dependent RNA helicase DDX43